VELGQYDVLRQHMQRAAACNIRHTTLAPCNRQHVPWQHAIGSSAQDTARGMQRTSGSTGRDHATYNLQRTAPACIRCAAHNAQRTPRSQFRTTHRWQRCRSRVGTLGAAAARSSRVRHGCAASAR
jgi:hypothetical protein